jgi:hypothetical protein
MFDRYPDNPKFRDGNQIWELFEKVFPFTRKDINSDSLALFVTSSVIFARLVEEEFGP